MIRPRLPRWLRKDTWVTDAPAGDLGSLDVANGMGECPPMDPEQADRLWEMSVEAEKARVLDECERMCLECDYLPPGDGRVVEHLPTGTHKVEHAGRRWVTDEHEEDIAQAVAIVRAGPWNAADIATARELGVKL